MTRNKNETIEYEEVSWWLINYIIVFIIVISGVIKITPEEIEWPVAILSGLLGGFGILILVKIREDKKRKRGTK